MTRETKLGLAVATSFLSLVAVVIYNAWKKEESPPAPQPLPPAVIAQAPAAKTEQKPAVGVERVGYQDKGTPPGPAPSALDLSKPAMPAGINSNVPAPSLGTDNNKLQIPTPVPDVAPAAKPGDLLIPPAPNPKTIDLPPIDMGSVKVPEKEQPKTTAPAPDSIGGPTPLPESPAKGPGAVAGLTEVPAGPQPPASPVGGPAPLTAPGTPAAANPLPGVGGSPAPLPIPSDPVPPPNSNAVPPPTGGGPKPLVIDPLPTPAAPQSIGNGMGPAGPLPPGGVPVVTAPGSSPGEPVPQKQPAPIPEVPVSPASPKAAGTTGSPSDVGINPNNVDASKPANPTTSGGSAAAVPVTQPGAATKPQVDSYNERRYVVQPTDPDFAAVSKRLYNSDKYAQALLEYNRDHPIGKAAAQNGQQLQAGAEVYAPPLAVLESRYPNAIQNLRPLTADSPKPNAPEVAAPPKTVPITPGPSTGSVVPPPAPVTNVQPQQVQPPSQPAIPGVQAKPAPTVPPANANPSTSGQYKTYTVPPGGQQFYQIARDTLGSGTRWPEIYQLNPQLDPVQMLPEGTRLKLPAEAHVGP